MYLLKLIYSVLALFEIFVLFASAIGLSVLAARLTVRKVKSLVDTMIYAESSGIESRVKRSKIESRLRRIPGGHNEAF